MADNKKPKEIVIPEKKPPLFPLEILEGQDREIITTERKPNLFTLDMPQTENIDLMRKQFLFIGEWNPSEDPLKIGEQNFSVLENYRYTDFGLEAVNGYTKINATTALATYLKGRSGMQLRTPYAIKSYVLIQAEKTDFSESAVKENRTAIPSQGDFQAGTLHVDAAGAGLGRFSQYPQGHLAYCNEKESCVYAGVETRVAGFFTFYVPTIVGSSDITFVDGGAGDDTITDGGSGFIDAGFKVGHQIIVTGTSNNNSEFILTGVAAGTLTLETGVLTGEVNTSAKITVSDKAYHINAKDHAEKVNNALQTEDQIVSIDGDTPGKKWIILTTRAAQGFKYYLKSLNATGSAATTCRFWDGTEFISTGGDSDGTDDGNGSMKQTGTFSFTSTDGSARPIHFEGLYLYAYLFELSAGSAEIYHITVDAPFQDMVDVWDGVYRPPISFQVTRGRTAAASGENSNGVIKTLQPGSVPYGHNYLYIHEVNATDYLDLQIGTEITANTVVRTVTGKTAVTAYSFYPSWAGFAYGGDTTKIQLVNEGDNFRWAGLQPGDPVVITGTTHNDGTYTLTYLLNGGMTAYFAGATFTAENAANAVFSRVSHYYVDTNAGADWYNADSGYSFTYKVPEDTAGISDYKDYSMDVLMPSYTDYPLGAVIDALDQNNPMIAGFEDRMSAIRFEMIAGLINTNNVKMKIGWWDGEQYTTADGRSDSTYGLPGTEGVNKSFNRTGILSWNPPDEKDEFRQTLFGKNLYYYEISLDGALTGTEGGAAEVVIDTVMGIPAQRTIKGYKFPAHYRNRPLLCGFVDGKEGNRVDYGMANTTSVFNGEDSSFGSRGPLYFGGSEDLTAYCEIYNRFGSAIYTTGIFTKATETYILTGYDVTTWQIHQISSILGCPASETMDTAEVGYDIGAEAVRNIAIWLSYMGPVIFDAGVLVPTIGKKIRCYFDKTDARCINFAAIDKSHGKVDPDNMEYNVWIPSGSGQTTCNVWLCLDLVRKKWFVKVPAGSDVYPQAAFRVMDDYGAEYLYGLRDNGRMMRLEHGADWDGNAIAQKVAGADLIPTGDMFDYTEIRRLKLVCISTTEDVDVTIKHYKDGSASSTTLLFTSSIVGSADITFSKTASPDTIVTAGGNFKTKGFKADDEITVSGGTLNDGVYNIVSISGDGKTITLGENVLVQDESNTSATITTLKAFAAKATDRHTRATQNVNLQGWSHRIEFSVSTSSETKGVRLLGWNVQFKIIREDT